MLMVLLLLLYQLVWKLSQQPYLIKWRDCYLIAKHLLPLYSQLEARLSAMITHCASQLEDPCFRHWVRSSFTLPDEHVRVFSSKCISRSVL